MIDLWMGRRDAFMKCEFWSVDDRDMLPADLIAHYPRPTGMFYAKEVNADTTENQIVESAFMAEQRTVTLETHDNVKTPVALKQNDIVRYHDELFRVDRIQSEPIKKQNQYLRVGSYRTYIQLRG